MERTESLIGRAVWDITMLKIENLKRVADDCKKRGRYVELKRLNDTELLASIYKHNLDTE